MDLIHELYTSLDSPVCYASADALYREAHKRNAGITRNDVINYLEHSPTYTLHHERRVNFRRSRIIPKGYFTDFQVREQRCYGGKFTHAEGSSSTTATTTIG